MPNLDDYPFEIRRLSDEDGGGFVITYPDFNVCMSDGETVEEAIGNGRDALSSVIATLREADQEVPLPGSGSGVSGRFVQRLPKSLHARLAARARTEGVSLNALITAMLAEQLGKREAA